MVGRIGFSVSVNIKFQVSNLACQEKYWFGITILIVCCYQKSRQFDKIFSHIGSANVKN
jgi:hypothetical protein